jgi:hypothetical protein
MLLLTPCLCARHIVYSCCQIDVLIALFLPSQGFFNFIIFIRPRFSSLRRNSPQSSRLWTLYQTVWSPQSNPQHRVEHGKRPIGGGPLNADRATESQHLDLAERIPVRQSEDGMNPMTDISWEDVSSQPAELGYPSNLLEDTFPSCDTASKEPIMATNMPLEREVPDNMGIGVQHTNPGNQIARGEGGDRSVQP